MGPSSYCGQAELWTFTRERAEGRLIFFFFVTQEFCCQVGLFPPSYAGGAEGVGKSSST